MQNNLFKIIDTLSSVRFKSVDVNAMTTVKGGTYWVNVVLRLLPSIGLSVTGPRVRAIVIIFRKFSFLASTQGIKGLVIHCKACSVLLAQAGGGHNIKDSGQLNCRVSRTNRGIPRFILQSDRLRLRNRDYAIEKFYQTIFNLMRILSFMGKPKLASITAPFSGSMTFINNEVIPFIPDFVSAILRQHNPFSAWEGGVTWLGFTKVTTPGRPAVMQYLLDKYRDLSPLWLAKSAAGTHHEGVQVSSHPYLMLRTVSTILRSDIAKEFQYFIELLPVNAPFKKAFESSSAVAYLFKPLFTLGKLGIKEEAAGKVRLFAMAPTWFQIMLEPVHSMIFEILRGIRQDGTFNQLGPLAGHHDKYKEAFSLDLTAATDRLPLVIQVEILSVLTGSKVFAQNWGRLLTGIDYAVNSLKYGLNETVKYSVGQPMGALSSWPSLAITHHFIVQLSAWRASVVPVGHWFKDYAVLGDDVVIFNRAVSKEYRRVISLIGMEIGLHKSILSREGTMIEFAKRIFHNGVDVSPVPFKEFFAALFGYGNLLDFGRKYNLTFVQLARTLGFKYRALSKVGSGFKCLPSGLKRLFVASSLPGVSSEVQPFLQLGAPIKARWPISLDLFWQQFSQLEFRSLLKAIDKRIDSASDDPKMFPHHGNFEKDPLLLNYISSRFHVAIGPWDMANWTQHIPNLTWLANNESYGDIKGDWILGPAEQKEDWCGFIMQVSDDMSFPIKINRFIPFRELMDNHPLKVVNLSGGDVKRLRWALACLFDAHILPKRTALRESLPKVRELIIKNWILPEDMNEVLINFLTVSREAALLPSQAVSFERQSPSSRSIDPISLRLWRKWGKLIQGTVSNRDINNKLRLPNAAALDPKGLSSAYENLMRVINS